MAYAEKIDVPFAEMNTTPLIDVLLVLLIMFIITIPVATHSIEIDLPSSDPVNPPMLEPDQNRLVVTAQDRILWNGDPVTEAQALAGLRLVETRVPEPETQIAPEAGASYDKTARLMRLVDVSGVTKVGFVGNERYRDFESD